MKLVKASIGVFQLRGGRQASIFHVDFAGKGTGMLLPVAAQGEPEMGHSWKPNGEYSVSYDGVPHMLDLVEQSSSIPKLQTDYKKAGG